MAAFGFSIGDIIAGLRVIYVSCEALKDASSSRLEYVALRTEIESLLFALEAIEDLDLDTHASTHTSTSTRTTTTMEKQRAAINASVASCKACIDEFLARAAKYEPHLLRSQGNTGPNTGGGAGSWIAGYRKIKWAVCKREDVARFRAQLERHASSINMLLITFQAQSQSQMGGRSHIGTETVAVCSTSLNKDDNVTDLLHGLTREQRQFFQLLITQNQQLQQSLDDIRSLLRLQSSIPPQVALQKPVLLLDAFGKTAPFHLDFIDSIDAFVAVLKIRSEQAGVRSTGLRKLDKREFCIRDTQRRRNIDLFGRPWERVFRPGQRVDMSMVFRRRVMPTVCPECGCRNEPCVADGEIECDFCGLWYHHVREDLEDEEPALVGLGHGRRIPSHGNSEVDSEKNFAGFRRVRIIAMMLKPMPPTSLQASEHANEPLSPNINREPETDNNHTQTPPSRPRILNLRKHSSQPIKNNNPNSTNLRPSSPSQRTPDPVPSNPPRQPQPTNPRTDYFNFNNPLNNPLYLPDDVDDIPSNQRKQNYYDHDHDHDHDHDRHLPTSHPPPNSPITELPLPSRDGYGGASLDFSVEGRWGRARTVGRGTGKGREQIQWVLMDSGGR